MSENFWWTSCNSKTCNRRSSKNAALRTTSAHPPTVRLENRFLNLEIRIVPFLRISRISRKTQNSKDGVSAFHFAPRPTNTLRLSTSRGHAPRTTSPGYEGCPSALLCPQRCLAANPWNCLLWTFLGCSVGPSSDEELWTYYRLHSPGSSITWLLGVIRR